MFIRSASALLLSFVLLQPAFSQEIHFTSVPDGYLARSIALPSGFAGALAVDPTDDRYIYASMGAFGANDLARVNVYSGAVQILAHGKFGALNGIAVIAPDKIVCIDNSGINSGPPNDTILLASDNNTDGDFDDAGEITELIAPILVDGSYGFTGAQARIAPVNQAGIPTGAAVVQTADGSVGNGAEILVIQNPLTAPQYVPTADAFLDGFHFNGGFDFAPLGGQLILGEQTDFLGAIHSIQDQSTDGAIQPEEDTVLASNISFLSDVTVDAQDRVYFTAANASFFGSVQLIGTGGSVSDFAVTDSSYLTGVLLNSKSRTFEADSGIEGAVMVVGGWVSDFSATGKNLLTLTPEGPSAARAWNAYE